MWMLSIALLALVDVVASSQCPQSAIVEAKLRPLLADSAAAHDRATIDASDQAVHVELRAADGRALAARTLSAIGSCDDRAQAVAVTIAAWESELPSAAPMLALPPPPVVAPVASISTRAQISTLAWDASVSFLGSIAGGSFAPGAAADVTLGKRGFPLSARIGVAGADSRDVSLASGRASWTRAALLFGPTFEALSRRSLRLDVHADVLLGWLFVQGRGYRDNYGDNAFDPALGGGARLAITKWSFEPWLDCTLLGWLRHQTVSVATPTDVPSAEIPRFDIWLRAGLAYGKR